MAYIIDSCISPNTWSYKRMTALPPGRHVLPKVITAAETWPFRTLMNFASPRFWRFTLPPQTAKDSRFPTFERFNRNSQVAASDATIEQWLEACRPFAQALLAQVDGGTSDPIVLSEADSWKKLCVQRGVQVSWYVPAISPATISPALPPLFVDVLRHVLSIYRRHWDRFKGWQHKLKPEPSTTNSGYPLFTTHPMAKLGGACLWRQNWDRSFEMAQKWAIWMRLPPDVAFGYGLSGRAGPGYKWAPEWMLTAGEWKADHEIRGHSQRNRVVQMSPYATNRLIRPLFARLHEPRRTILGLWRTVNEDAILHADGVYNYEGDISGFDTSVSYEAQLTFASAMEHYFPEASDAIVTWLACEQRPLLCPSFRRQAGECTASFSWGGISSGGKATSGFGTVWNVAATLYALSEQGFDVMTWPNMSDIAISVQGDDVRISTRSFELDTDKFTASFEKLGLSCALRPGYVFLAKHLGPGGRTWPLAGRLIQQTMSNEKEPTHPYALGILQVGFRARFEMWKHVPPEYKQAVWTAIRHAEWIKQTSCTSVEDLLAYLNDPAQLDVQKEALKSTEGQVWLASEERHADASMTAQDILRLASTLGCTPQNILSQDATIETIANKIHDLSDTAAWTLLTEITEATILGGGPRLDRLLDSVMKGKTKWI